jgi:hypothetical protein
MKRALLTVAAIALAAVFGVAQNVPRDKVIVEIGTGTWCQYCPGAAMGADDLIANGHPVAIIEYHNGDDYANTFSNSRNSYYNISGFPTAFFDGGLSVVGGSNTQSMYPQYSTRVNQRAAITSPFSLEVEGTHTCFTNFTANITIEKVGTNSSSNLRVHAVLTESHIEVSWFGLHEVNYVCRKMMPNQNGTTVSFSGGNTQTISVNFSLEPDYVPENCELVVFIQDNSTKEIFQGTKMSLLDFLPEYDFDATVHEVANLPEANCSGSLEPVITIKNLGGQPLFSLEISYSVNNGDPQTYSWTGALDYLAAEEVTLPAITFPVQDDNNLVVECSLPNGQTDECTSNDVSTVIVPRSAYTPNTVKLLLRTDVNPTETTWEVVNGNGEVVYSGGPYTTAGQTIQATFDLPDEACHYFRIYDAGGDGFTSQGFYLLYYGTNTSISQVTGQNFGFEHTVEFNTTDPVGIDDPFQDNGGVSVYPNPFSGNTTFSFTLASAGNASVKVYSLTGQEVASVNAGFLTAGTHYLNLNGSALKAGMYLYKVVAGEGSFTGKIIVK